jgi:hypothetical protein
MSEYRETSSRHLASTTQHQTLQSEAASVNTVPTSEVKRRKRSSTSSNGTATDSKPSPSRRRSGNSKTLVAVSDAGSSRTARQSTTSPNNMSSVNYTKTGRVSKAKKGLKVHDCECGRVRVLSSFQSLIPCFLFVGESVLITSSLTHGQNT